MNRFGQDSLLSQVVMTFSAVFPASIEFDPNQYAAKCLNRATRSSFEGRPVKPNTTLPIREIALAAINVS